MNKEEIRKLNVGGSNYHQHSIQPWDLWEYAISPWHADIIKRLLRTKRCSWYDRAFHPFTCDSRLNDYRKIEHILLKIQDLISKRYKFKSINDYKELHALLENTVKEYHLNIKETGILYSMFLTNPTKVIINNYSPTLQGIKDLIKEEEDKQSLYYKLIKWLNNKLNK